MENTDHKTHREPAFVDYGMKKAAARVAKLASRAAKLPGFFAKPMPQLTKAPRRKGRKS